MHILLGNIIGSLLAAFLSPYGRGWSFLATGANVAMVGLLVFFFLTPHPRDLGFISSNGPEERLEAASLVTARSEKRGIVHQQIGVAGNIGFTEAWRIPKMVPFAFSLFFMKVVSSTFMYWLSFYLSREGGPNALITTAVCADLGTYGSLATVTAIIDGTGSIGGALGPFLTGLFLPTEGWNRILNCTEHT